MPGLADLCQLFDATHDTLPVNHAYDRLTARLAVFRKRNAKLRECVRMDILAANERHLRVVTSMVVKRAVFIDTFFTPDVVFWPDLNGARIPPTLFALLGRHFSFVVV